MSATIIEEPVHKTDAANTTAQSDAYRNYVDGKRQARVEGLYGQKYTKQTVEYARRRVAEYGKFDKCKMSIWEALEFLNQVVDESDPDVDLPQIHHAFQTAEACRRACPDQDWFHLLGLIHDLGKVLATPKFGELQQWEVVGDIWPMGCAPTDANVLPHLFEGNPDLKDPRYNTRLGMYTENCGLSKVLMAFSHDEYLWMVLKNHKQCTLPEEAFYCIRYHSFYPWHNKAGYMYLADETDMKMLPVVQMFQKCDLYSKVEVKADYDELATYYKGLIEKYCPGTLSW